MEWNSDDGFVVAVCNPTSLIPKLAKLTLRVHNEPLNSNWPEKLRMRSGISIVLL